MTRLIIHCRRETSLLRIADSGSRCSAKLSENDREEWNGNVCSIMPPYRGALRSLGAVSPMIMVDNHSGLVGSMCQVVAGLMRSVNKGLCVLPTINSKSCCCHTATIFDITAPELSNPREPLAMAIALLLYLVFCLFYSVINNLSTLMVVRNPLMTEDAAIEGILKRTDVISKSTSVYSGCLVSTKRLVHNPEVCLVTVEKTFKDTISSVGHLNSDALDTIAR